VTFSRDGKSMILGRCRRVRLSVSSINHALLRHEPANLSEWPEPYVRQLRNFKEAAHHTPLYFWISSLKYHGIFGECSRQCILNRGAKGADDLGRSRPAGETLHFNLTPLGNQFQILWKSRSAVDSSCCNRYNHTLQKRSGLTSV
jgi:hypothetical protein